MCEIYLTDCCDDADAEAQIESFLTEIAKINHHHHQYLITAASTRISQSRQEDAKEYLTLFFKNLSRDYGSIPDYDCRISATKLCIETQLYDHALDLLELNLQIDEDDGETWYLFGWIYFLLVNDGEVEYETDMIECWDRLFLIQEKNGNIDPDLLDHVKQLRLSRQGQ
jgi:tetratricopeptide (TPR) repeat protein